MKRLRWILFVFFAVTVGVYPVAYFFFPSNVGLLATKDAEVLKSLIWNVAFYLHIGLGGVSLLAGWSQFSRKLRTRNVILHRRLGITYVTAVAVSGITGLYIALFATGGIVPQMGFSGLALAWMFTTWRAYSAIRVRHIDRHEAWMIRSYALCFAAVTLRIWLPLMDNALGWGFIFSYRIVSWLCWVPNLVVAEMIIARMRPKRVAVRVVEVEEQ